MSLLDLLDGDPGRRLGAPLVPDRSWFFEIPDGYNPFRNLDDPLIWIGTGEQLGRFAAGLAPYGECILDADRRQGGCWTAPTTQTDYEYAYGGKRAAVLGSEGPEEIGVGNVCADIPHATGRETPQARRAAFDDTSKIRARVRYVDRPDLGGIFALGALVPTATVWDALSLQAAALSGEWWPIRGLAQPELVGPIVVAEPGFRRGISRTRRAAVFASATVGDGPIVAGWSPMEEADVTAAGLFDESKVTRGDGGRFAKKGEGGGGQTSTQDRKTAVTVTGKPKAKAKKGKKKKGGGGAKPKPTDEEKAAQKVAADKMAQAKAMEDIRTSLGDDPDSQKVAKALTQAMNDLANPEREGYAVEGVFDAYAYADRAAGKLGESENPADQAKAAKMKKIRDALNGIGKQVSGRDVGWTSDVDAAKAAKNVTAKRVADEARAAKKIVTDEAKAAREVARAERDAARVAAKAERDASRAKAKADREAKAAERAAKKGASVTTEIEVAAADSAVPPETPSGAVLVALPAIGQWTDDIDDAHCTIAYVPGDQASEVLGLLRTYAEQEAASRAPFVATTAGTGRIGNEDASAVFLNSADLVELYNESTDDLEDAHGVEQSFPSFIAHVTTGYDAAPVDHDPERRIIFDRLAVWNGEDRVEYPFTGDEAFAPFEPDPILDQEELAMATAGPIHIPVVLSVTTTGMPAVITSSGTLNIAAAPCSCQTAHAAEGKEAVMADETPEVAVAAAADEIPEVDAEAIDPTPEAAAPVDTSGHEQRIADLEDAVRELLAAEAARQASEVPEMEVMG